jgi:hypothetical protein
MEAVMRMKMMAAAVALLTLAAPVAAQQAPTTDSWMMGPGYSMGYGGMPMMGMMNGAQHVEGRLAFLKTELKITPAQEAVWDDYAKALRANAQKMTAMMKNMPGGGWGMMNSGMMNSGMTNQGMMNQGQGMMSGGAQAKPMTLPQRLDWMEQHMAQHMEMLQAIKGPAEALYKALDAAQKQTADQLLMGPMGMM